MRKNASFGVGATVLVLATIFWAQSSVVSTSAYSQPKLGMSYVAMPGTFQLVIKTFEPIW